MLSDELQILLLACLCRGTIWSSLLVLPRYVLAFDTSASQVLANKDLWLQGLLRWDALHFERIARNGYTLEQEFAFMPALPWIMHFLGSGFGLLSYSSGRAVLWTSVLALACSILSVIVFHRLSLRVLASRPLAKQAAILYCITPSPATLVSPYNEPFYAIFAFIGMLLVQRKNIVTAALLFACATAFRANGMLNAGFVVYPLLQRYIKDGKIPLSTTIQIALSALLVVFPFVWRQYQGYRMFCQDTLEPRPWCKDTIPSIYSFVQDHYWDVGLFRYWTLLQLPLFLLSAPVLALCFSASWSYYRSRLALPFLQQIVEHNQSGQGFCSPRLLPYIHLSTLLTCILFFASHVQIILRLIATNPVPYWYAAHLLSVNSRYGSWWIRYCLIWSPISVVLWVGFYPPA